MEKKYTKDYNFKKKEIRSKRQNARIDRFQNDKTDLICLSKWNQTDPGADH